MMEAIARHIEDLTLERDRWKNAYIRLASNRLRWVDQVGWDMHTIPFESHDAYKNRFINKLKARLRRW